MSIPSASLRPDRRRNGAFDPRELGFYPQGDPNNPTNVACIADGNWIIQVYSHEAATGTLTLGKGQWNCGILAGGGVLDLRGSLGIYDGVDYRLKKFTLHAFQKYPDLVELHVDGVISLGGGMLWACPNLETVSISGTATTIPDSPWDYQGTFASCSKLHTMTLDLPGLTSIGSKAFFNDSALVADIATLCPPTVTKVGHLAFLECRNLYGHLRLDNVESLASQCFEHCSSIQELTLASETLTEIPGESYGSNRGLFHGCTSLTNITMNCPNLTVIGTGMFRGVGNAAGDFEQLVPPSVIRIDPFAFYGCAKFTGTLNLPNIHTIGQMAFTGCSGLGRVSLGGRITSLPERNGTYNQAVFSSCGITNLEISAKSFASIGNGAFEKCSALDAIVFGSTNALTLGGNNTFNAASKLREVHIESPAWLPLEVDRLLYSLASTTGGKTCTLYVPKARGWDAHATTDYTENEQATRPRRCFGVYREGSRKAWLVNNDIPFASTVILW